MKAIFEQIKAGRGESLLYKEISLPVFDAPFHFHPEYELTYIRKGRGMRYVGMGAEAFGPGDCVLLGPELPHCWLNQPEEGGSLVEACVVQFHESIWKETLCKWPEFDDVVRLLDQARGGVVFHIPAGEDLFLNLHETTPPRRLIYLLDLLLKLATLPNRTLIETDAIYEDQQRFRVVFGYLISHFREHVDLRTVSDLVGLTPTSFCRYFKKITGKTLFDVVLHYRLEAVTQLLVGTERPISEIAFESGFESINYFNRAFKKWKGSSPSVYREQYRR